MRPEHGYIKTIIEGIPYLLPYGQQIADHYPGIRLNASASILWDALCEGAEEEELLKLLIHHYEADTAQLPVIKNDLECFLKMLKKNCLLRQEEPSLPHQSEKEHFFRIGPLTFAYRGPKSIFSSCFLDFSCECAQADQTISISFERPKMHRNGEILLRNEQILIAADETMYILIYPETSCLFEVHIKKDGTSSCFYCKTPFDETFTSTIFHAIRFSFLILAQQRNLYVLHSASLLYQDGAWLFSGRSGTGKSTHTALWQSLFQTPILNGDLNLIGMENGQPVVYGIPWCGTSGIHTAKTFPLSGIVFLKQANKNTVTVPSPHEKALFCMQRMISPTWTPELLLQNLTFSTALIKTIPVFRFACTKELSAAQLMKETIDRLNVPRS